jgi:hypothetical protein
MALQARQYKLQLRSQQDARCTVLAVRPKAKAACVLCQRVPEKVPRKVNSRLRNASGMRKRNANVTRTRHDNRQPSFYQEMIPFIEVAPGLLMVYVSAMVWMSWLA